MIVQIYTFVLVAYNSILSIILVTKKYLVILPTSSRSYVIFCKTMLVFYYIVDNRNIKIMKKIGCF